jgi:hypothetical protein
MFHACFTPITLCFVHTLWHFYVFSATNLLTRCHSANSYFLLFFYSRFLSKEIVSKLDESKAKVPIFLTWQQSPKGRRRRAGWWPHHRVAWANLWPCSPMVWAPQASTDLALPPIYCPRRKNPKESASIHEKFCSAAAIEDKFWGTEISVLAPCRDGKLPLEPSPSTPPPSSLPLLTPIMRRE